MNLNVDFERLRLAHKTVHAELLAERAADGHWIGRVASSPVATAAAISALVVAHRRSSLAPSSTDEPRAGDPSADAGNSSIDLIVDGQLSELVIESLHWLARVQNADGGWGDCPNARSNLAATALVQAAFRLTGVPGKYADLMAAAQRFVTAQGGVTDLRRRAGVDKTWAAAVLANGALAGMVPWRLVPALPFEQFGEPQRWWQKMSRLAAPMSRSPLTAAVQIAVGLAKFHNNPPRNPLTRLERRGAQAPSLALLAEWQAADGSFLASPNWTAFVVMNLASIGFQEHAIVRSGVEYLLSTVRADASWPLIADLSTRNTALAMKCLASDTADEPTDDERADDREQLNGAGLDWLLTAQHSTEHGSLGISAGGWAASGSPSALPNVSDTANALIAMAHPRRCNFTDRSQQVDAAATGGLAWLLNQQHDDGGWTMNCGERRSRRTSGDCADTTSDALCALALWAQDRPVRGHAPAFSPQLKALKESIHTSAERGFAWLASKQNDDGSFAASAFGNERQSAGQNFVYGTARALAACATLGRLDSTTAHRAAGWLARAQHAAGGWGPPRTPVDYSGAFRVDALTRPSKEVLAKSCSVEETSWAVAALLPLTESEPVYATAVANGLNWLAAAVEKDLHRRPALVGVCLAKLWYDERLYPLVFAADTLSRAVRVFAPQQPVETVTA